MTDTAPSPPPAALRLRYSAMSDLGRYRKDNQDSGYASEHLLVIADGVGGAAFGDVASSTAVHVIRRLDAPPEGDQLASLADAIHRISARLGELVAADRELDGTSTTVTAALFDGSRIAVAHVGDSRAYLLREGRIHQITKDHTFVQTLVDEGQITEEESRSHPHRNLILRAVDAVHEAEPDLFYVELEAGDRLLLCSDGCSGVLTDRQLGDILGGGGIDFVAVELVRQALDAGTTDNVTVVVAEVLDATADPAGAAEPGGDAATETGPMLVGAAAAQPRRAGHPPGVVRSLFKGHRSGDTGELEPIEGDEGPDTEQLRYAPRPPRRYGWLRRVALAVVLAAILAAAGRLGYHWTQQQYFVAADGPYVAIYRGVDVGIPGLDLADIDQTSRVTIAALPSYWAEQVDGGIGAIDLQDAEAIIVRLTDLAVKCPVPPTAAPSPSPTASASPSAKPSAKPSASPSKSPSANPSKRPSPETTAKTASPTASATPTPSLAPPDCIEAAQ